MTVDTTFLAQEQLSNTFEDRSVDQARVTRDQDKRLDARFDIVEDCSYGPQASNILGHVSA